MKNGRAATSQWFFIFARGSSMRFVSFCVLLMALPGASHAGSLKESWYLYRGRSNMEIKNYRAAIEAFEKAVEINPENREAQRSLGLAYDNEGLTDKAVSQFDNYLAKFPDDGEVALRQAQMLTWSRYSYRHADAAKYYQMALKHHEDNNTRLQYANLLASRKETSQDAIREYNQILKRNPNSGAAHRGLAKAYAWNGESDLALYHTQQAAKLGAKDSETASLERNLSQGRGPELGTRAHLLSQSSHDGFDLSGVRLSALGGVGLTPFVSARIEAGMESFWNNASKRGAGFFELGGQFRPGGRQAIDWMVGNHGVGFDAATGVFGNGGDGTVYFAQYSVELESWTVRPGFRRDLRYDSYMALVGQRGSNGTLLGAARDNRVYVQVEGQGSNAELQLTPYVGWVSSANASNNSMFGVDARVKFPWGSSSDEGQWSLLSLTHYSHCERDQSGFSLTTTAPFGGGYFSPDQYLNESVRVGWTSGSEGKSQWQVEVGPAIQYVKDSQTSGAWLGGGGGRFFYVHTASKSLDWQVDAELERVSDLYMRLQADLSLRYHF
ncbi:MAG: hypothetical protein C5B49_16630 [Bdellovibrio sp.]|nr:MAG: hypothetical protein C5B49_16630 [Bdellovibrio sp.]